MCCKLYICCSSIFYIYILKKSSFFCLSKNVTVEKFNSANGVVQRAVQVKRMMDGRGGGRKNRGVSGMVCGCGGDNKRRVRRDVQMTCSIQELAMVRMENWVDRDTSSVVYSDESSYDSRANHRDRGRSRYSGGQSRIRSWSHYDSRSRSLGRGHYKDTPPVYE